MDPEAQRKTDELRSFLLLTVVMVPAFAVVLVAGYGFAVWMYQLIAGPPTGGGRWQPTPKRTSRAWSSTGIPKRSPR